MASVSYTGSTPGSKVKRWYVWHGTRKERLAVYVKRMRAQGRNDVVADIMTKAVRQGYRL